MRPSARHRSRTAVVPGSVEEVALDTRSRNDQAAVADGGVRQRPGAPTAPVRTRVRSPVDFLDLYAAGKGVGHSPTPVRHSESGESAARWSRRPNRSLGHFPGAPPPWHLFTRTETQARAVLRESERRVSV